MASKAKKSKKTKKTKKKKAAAAVKKKAATKRTAKKPVKKPAKKTAKKAAKKKAPARKAVKAKKKAAPPAKKKQIVGEGDYAASRIFLKDQAGFVKRNKAKIPALAKEAEQALEGPEGKDLLAAEAEAKSHSKAAPEE